MNEGRTVFAQLTWRESLRDIETCLASFGPKLYHAGIHQPTARNTLAVANEKRDWRIFADFAHVLIRQATTLYADEPIRFEPQAAAYALDSTTIDLCLSLFPWATFRRAKAAIKLHTLLTLQGNFPTVIIVSTGSVHDVNILDQLVWEAGSFYIMDRGDLDDAMTHFALSLQLNANNAAAQRNYARALAANGRLEEAIEKFRAALNITPNGRTRLQLAPLLAARGSTTEAIFEFRAVLKARPDNVEALNNLAWILATCSDAALRNGVEAVNYADKAWKLSGGRLARSDTAALVSISNLCFTSSDLVHSDS